MNADLPHDEESSAARAEELIRHARDVARHDRAWHRAQTERLRVYATLLRVTLPRIGAMVRPEIGSGLEIEIDPDVASARHLAVEAVLADIRRIAGEQA